MEKNKNRSDLLAAGRKKLQQFRQKKDGKGSKSSGKAGKSERDVDAEAGSAAAKPAVVSLQVPDGEISSVRASHDGVVDSSASHFMENSVTTDADTGTFDPSSMPVVPKTGIVESSSENNVEVPLEHSGVGEAVLKPSVGEEQHDDSLVTYEGESSCTVDPKDTSFTSVGISETIVSEVESLHVGSPVAVDLLAPLGLVDSMKPDANAIETECAQGEDQVTIVGAMQEADHSGSKLVGQNIGIELELDGSLALSGFGESAETHAGTTSAEMSMKEATLLAEQTNKLDVSASAGANNEVGGQGIDSHLVSSQPLPESDGSSAATPDARDQQRADVVAALFNEVKSEMPSTSNDFGSYCTEQVGADKQDNTVDAKRLISKGHNQEWPLDSKMVRLSSGADVGSITLGQLAEVIRGLDENELRFLLISRESSTNAELRNPAFSFVSEYDLSDDLERLKEQLYLTSFAKDVFYLQLHEQSKLHMEFDHQHHQLVDEVSIANDSLNEVRGRNESLVGELTQCRSELQAVAYARDEFQKQFHTSHAEVEEFSARVDELNIKLGKSQGDLSSLSVELADCRGLLAALEVENGNLNGRLNSLTDEKLKLEEEKGHFVIENEKLLTDLAECKGSLMSLEVQNVNIKESLALMTAERTKLEEEKEFVVSENRKLVTDLADCKVLMEALQVEHANLNGVLSSATEERKKVGEEKEYFARETEKMSIELSDCQSLVEALQVEITKLNGSLTSVMEERNKLGEEKGNFVIENDKLLEELASCKCLMEGLQVGHSKAVDNLKEATLHLEQLTEENVSLNSSLDMHKTKIKEFEDGRYEFLSQSGEAGNQVEASDMPSKGQESATEDDKSHRIPGNGELIDGLTDKSPLKHLKLNAYDDSFRFVVLKGHLEEAEKTMQKLEKAIDGLHSHSVSLSRLSNKVVAPGVSKLIQAFESKTHLDDHEEEEVPPTENQSPADLFTLAKEQTGNLRAVLKELGLDADNASELFKTERDGRVLADVTFRELSVTYEALKGQSNVLEAANVELVVLYEIIKQHVCDIEAKKGELLVLFEAVKQQDIILEAQNSESGKRLSEYESVVSDLQRRLNEMHLSSNEMSSSIYNQLENLHKEVAERTSILEQEWNSTVAEVVQSIGKLDALVGSLFSSSLSTDTHDGLDISSRVAASVDATTKVIEHLHEKLSAVSTDHEAVCSSYKELTEKFNDLHGKNELAIGVLHKIFGNLTKLVNDSCVYIEPSEELLDPLHPSNYDTLMEKLGKFLCERMQLVSENNRLNSELIDRAKDIEEDKKRCLDLDAILKLVEDVEGAAELALIEKSEIDPNKPTSCLESLVSFLVQKYKEADEKVGLSRERYDLKEAELIELKGQIDQLSFLVLQHENETLILKESLSQAEEDLVALHSELQEKVTEIELSEQRVSSLREKLSIAVSKGKGLVVQRDSLKQSLAETSIELEKCLQEMQLKDARFREVETKLKTYSEAGERMEALESELSYIRNSATALRESFLLKDSVLQRIEEILEDLELPEHFHSKDIIEKVNWLARTVTGNSLPLADWDQKSSVGGSYTDAGFVVMDAWKEDVHPNSTSGDDLRRKYEELQNKFYGLAEQNEMLEQSLMERNSLVQRWEECLDRINMPTQLRSLEPENRIEWLRSALSEVHQHCNSLQQKIDNFEKSWGSLTADLEESQTKISNLEAALQDVLSEKEHLSENLETLTRDYDKISEKAVQFELEKDKLQNEITALQDKLAEKVMTEDCIYRVEDEIRRLQNLITHVLQDSGTEDVVSGGSSIECLEGLLRKLIEKYTALSLENPVLGDAVDEHITEKANVTHDEKRMVDSGDAVEQDIAVMKKELEDALGDLMCVKEERDRYMEKNQCLVHEVEALNMRRQELQDLLSLEEQKSASVREKLNVAVRKGKSLVQQRDSLKQTIEEANIELERLKSEINSRENTILEYKRKIMDLSTYQERVEALESESFSLRDRLAETEYSLQEKGHALSMILNTLCDVDVGYEFNISDPVKKLEQIGKLCRDLHAAVDSSENDSRKSKRAAELLLAELNEVQERNDGLQEELSKATSELSELSKERDSAEAAKCEALSRLEKLSAVHSDKRNNQFAELMLLKSGVDQLMKGFFDVNNLLGDVLSKDLEFLHNLEAGVKSCLKASDAPNMTGLPFGGALGSIKSPNSESKENFLDTDSMFNSKMQLHFDDNLVVQICSLVGRKLQDFTMEIDALKEKLYTHSISLHEEAKCLSEVVGTVFREIKFQKQSFETMKENIIRLEHIEKEKSAEIDVMRRNISLLYEACTSSVMQIENWKVQMIENGLAAADQRIILDSPSSVDGGILFSGLSLLSSEECIQTMVDRLLSVVKDSICMQADIVEGGQKELKITISNLQRELREKDIQKDRICVELVGQIKEAEAAARSYLQDLQSEKARVHDLERKVELMEEEHNMLEHRVKELQLGEATSKDLQERVRSLTDVLAAKDQEIESLMQALDEEETQMEDLTNKISELERVVQLKNLDLESAEASRGKAMKKLSITVSKFDELHHFSTSLLSEVEKLQSQLQERDAEISFLRQEVTRCTNDALVASQMNNKKNAAEVHDFLSWLNTTFSQVDNAQFDDKKNDQVDEFDILQKQIMSIISELEDLRVAAQSRDTLLQVERNRVEELLHKEEFLKKSLHEKESQLSMLQGVGDSGEATSVTSEIVEVEPINKWAVPGTSRAPQVRSLRKVNNDQVAVAIDLEPGSGSRLDDEDDDKAHGFKSLTTSSIVPRFTRPLTDMIDGLWVSCDRTLMRQPALRLGVIIYWAVIHALLATFVV